MKVTLSTATGQVYDLTGSTLTSPVLVPEEGLTNLTGAASRNDVPQIGRAGVLPGDVRFGAISTELQFYLHADTGAELAKLYTQFRQGWKLYRLRQEVTPCVLSVTSDKPGGPYKLDLYAGQPLQGVPVNMSRRTQATVPVQVFSPAGLFYSRTYTGRGTVTVENSGDATIWPRIRYAGGGAKLVSPSGARVSLPRAATETLLDLNPSKLRQEGVFPEGVEPGHSAQWKITGGQLEWEILVADPWA